MKRHIAVGTIAADHEGILVIPPWLQTIDGPDKVLSLKHARIRLDMSQLEL